ncbi:MAG: hypothetical protein KatS3mg105_1465 [Gemmatales bacterium]|nr:MAG: hypothetical protein KatS3mg105_1465 [Gemmatales bacterium]
MLASLERYYELQLSLRKQFRARIAAPVFQFVIALFLIALVIWLMGILPGFRDNDITLFGLAGPSGAGIFLGVVFGTIAGVLVGWWVLSRTLRGRAAAAVRTILVNHLRDEILQLVCPAQAEPVGT